MNALFPVPDTVPADLYGHGTRDRITRLLHLVVETRLRWAAVVHRRDVDPAVDDRRFPAIVTQRQVEAHDENVVSLVLAAPDGGELPQWRPGAHLDLELPSGRLRQYSLCGDPADTRRYRIAVRRIPDGDGGSIEVHDELPVGSRVMVRGPRNAFAFAVPGHGSPARRLHFIAGGIGITPILPMMRLAHRLGIDWSMTYTGRSRDSLPFLDEVETFGGQVEVRTDDDHGLPNPRDLLRGVSAGTAVYCCGPVAMTSALIDAVRAMPDVEFHSERFSAPPVVDGTPFEITLARTGEVVSVPADRSALDAIREVRPDVAYSCRQGFCRTCRVRVLNGAAEHRDGALTPAEREQGQMLICVSRCVGDKLTLDL